MVGTAAGGRKTAETNLKRDPNFYSKIGRKGGMATHRETRYFTLHPEVARRTGAKGGRISRRGPAKKEHEEKLTADSDFVEHIIPKRRWPWSK